MSAPTIERYSGMNDGEDYNNGNVEKLGVRTAAKEVLGKAATNGEAVAARPNLDTPVRVEAFLSDMFDKAGLDIESTRVYATSGGTEVRAARITSTEELVQVELPEPDEELGVTGLVIDAEYIDPYLSSGDTLVKVATVRYGEDGQLILDRITDPEKKGYATARIADAVSEAIGGPSEITSESRQKRVLHEESLKLTDAMRLRHAEIDL